MVIASAAVAGRSGSPLIDTSGDRERGRGRAKRVTTHRHQW
ncbi:hypothetical protein MOTT12_03651 [Mycobacterium intracellulare subsp. yongonense]|nr:hypothetical protein MOTT12_03651 [Mycobacterium intracellulare subsp. yongonense]ARR84386.1 hypothetical protein MOTT27_03565 [Mycobacterium intracellulare subsp. yongonense]